MKFILLFLLSLSAYAGTCTSDSYTSASANSVLTSTKYNSDHSTIYNRLAGNLDGGCIADSTVEKVALNSSEFAPLYDSFKDGCKVTRTDAATLSIGSCRLAVDGEWVNKTTATSVTWGCGSCASEVAATQYYLYVADGSTGSTLTPLISTTAPTDGHGEDGSNNKVIARFYNNASSDIDQYSIDQWHVNRFIPQETGWVDGGALNIVGVTTTPTKSSPEKDKLFWKRTGGSIDIKLEYHQTSTGGSDGSGVYLIKLPNAFAVNTSFTGVSTAANYSQVCGTAFWAITSATTSERPGYINVYDSNFITLGLLDTIADHRFWGSADGGTTAVFLNGVCRLPILGWGE